MALPRDEVRTALKNCGFDLAEFDARYVVFDSLVWLRGEEVRERGGGEEERDEKLTFPRLSLSTEPRSGWIPSDSRHSSGWCLPLLLALVFAQPSSTPPR